MSKVTVLGAAGGVGSAVVRELADRGHAVTAVTRTGQGNVPDGVAQRSADLSDRAQAVAACAGAEVVVMAAHIPYERWAAELEPLVDNAVAGAEAARARLVMVDNLYAYGAPDRPIGVGTPEAATTRKGAMRRRMGQRLLQAHRDGRLRVTIGRFSDYYGPGGTNSVVHALGVKPALEGKRLRALIDPDEPHTFHYLPDAARGLATLVERPDAEGRVWVLPAAPAITQRELLSLVAAEAGALTRIGRISPLMLALIGVFNRRLRELRELSEQWDRPYVTEASAFETAFGPLEVTSHAEAVAETVAAFRPDGQGEGASGDTERPVRRRGVRRWLGAVGAAVAPAPPPYRSPGRSMAPIRQAGTG